jgi:hypothetical protein
MAKFFNFDAYVAERNKTRSVTFKLFDETFYLPPTIPFEAALLLQTMANRNKDDVVSDQFVTDLFVRLVGQDVFDTIKAHNAFDIDLLTNIMSWILQQYGVQNEETPKEETPVIVVPE